MTTTIVETTGSLENSQENNEIKLYVEVDPTYTPRDEYGDLRNNTVEKAEKIAKDLFSDGMDLVRLCAAKTVQGIQKIDPSIRPEEFELKLAIKLDSELGAVVAKASAGAQLEVTMKWQSKA